MIVDSSALIAIIEDERGAGAALEAAVDAPCRMSVASWVEAGIVADARSTGSGHRLDELVAALDIELVPVDRRHGQVARDAYRRYGRGSGSKARLNYGDCFSYALAVVSGEPLLYVGDDFGYTDVRAAARR
ncbi:MAG: type II toxin-antitoxin system VapC family toxin [Dermatophilaceae bacterium]